MNGKGRIWHVSAGHSFPNDQIDNLIRLQKLCSFSYGCMAIPKGILTDLSIERLVRHPRLAGIMIEGCNQLTDKSIEHIASNPWIRWVSLNCKNITNEGMRLLPSMPHLIRFGVAGSQVTDESIKYFFGLKNLKYLFLYQCKVSPSAITILRNALPCCTVKTDANDNAR